MPRKKKDEYGDEKLNGTFNVKSFEDAMVEIHDKEQLSIDKVKALLENSLLKAYKDWWCIKSKIPTSNASDLKATIHIDWESGVIHICDAWEIMPSDDDIVDDFYQTSLEEAQKIGIPTFKKELAKKLKDEASKLKDAAASWQKKAESAKDENVKSGALEAQKDDLARAEELEKKAKDMTSIKVGGLCEKEIDYAKLDRLYIRRVISDFHQRMREEGKRNLMEFYSAKLGHNIVGTVSQIEDGSQTVDIDFGKAHGRLGRKDMLPSDVFHPGEQVKVFLKGVTDRDGIPSLEISRTHEGYVRALYEDEVPEVADGTVLIKKIARQPGIRTKIMVTTTYPNVDPVGAVMGQGALRSRNILAELGRETVDVSRYTEDKVLNILNALKPANIVGLKFPPEGMPDEPIIAVCANNNKKVAVGKAGCNVRLAGRLVGHDLRILETDEALSQHINFIPVATLEGEANERIKKLHENEIVQPVEHVLPKKDDADKTVLETRDASSESEVSLEATKAQGRDEVLSDASQNENLVPAEALKASSALKEAREEAKALEKDSEDAKKGIEIQKQEEQGVLPSETAVKVIKPVAPEEHVEITGRAKFDLENLEQQIERERSNKGKTSNHKPWAKPKPDKKKDESEGKGEATENKKPVEQMAIYTPEELQEMQDEEDKDQDDYNDDEDFDEEYDDDKYYDDDKK